MRNDESSVPLSADDGRRRRYISKGPTVGGLNASGFLQDWTGLRLIRSPDWTANASFDYTHPLPQGSLYVSANVAYQSEQSPATATLFQTLDAAGVVSAPGGEQPPPGGPGR